MDIFDLYPDKIHPEPNTGCWLWIGGLNGLGYGRISISKKQTSAHRFSYKTMNGEIPIGLIICHTCDQPSCVNPLHLFIGSNKDNTQDMISKQRHDFNGLSKVGNPKLNINQVTEIRQQKGKLILRVLAAKYGVTIPTIHYILRNKTWHDQ